MYKSFGLRIRQERQKQNLTVLEVATACKTSRSYITLIENGKRSPGKKVLPKIASALKLKTADVLNWYLEEMRQKLVRGVLEK